MMKWLWLLAAVGGWRQVHSSDVQYDQETKAASFMENLNKENAIWSNRMSIASWAYESDLTDYNLQNQLKVSADYNVFYKKQWEEVIKYPRDKFKDPLLKRQFKFYSILGTAALPEDKRARLDEVIAKMSDIYSTTKLLEWQDPGKTKPPKPTVALDPDLTDFFANHAEDNCKLQYYWEGWHGSVGRKEKKLFEEYVNLEKEAAELNNYTDVPAMWNEDFEMENFDEAMQKLYQQILPFYEQLHAYVRKRLNDKLKITGENGCLPAHILGNVWAQEWQHIYNSIVPYRGKVSVDVTPTMKAQEFTPKKMFEMAEEFYTSINMKSMTKTFWEKSIIEKPKDRDMVCHASAWDFSIGDDYRIKMCTRVNLEDFKVIHHEMGHIQYYMAYKDQPHVFRGGANSGFHEAVGDTIALSVSTAEHLTKVGLLDSATYVKDTETEINELFLMALEKVAFLPYAYVLDLWRWDVFRGKTPPKEYNCRFWQLRQELQGIVPPVDRSASDFDAGAKYHVIADVPYIRYFVSFIIQFQFHKALCIEAKQYNPNDPSSKPLHHCDIYKSTEAGNLLSKMLQMGSSKPPQDAMEVITGQRDMDAGPLLEYFKPLHDWLIQENQRTGTKIGWTGCGKIDCSPNGDVKIPQNPGEKKCRYDFPKESPQDADKV